ncbi:MAG: PKD domain-containing protein [Bacteroidota bacterium]
MKRIIALIVFGLAAFTSFAQDFSNKGKDFWVGYGWHCRMTANPPNQQEMVLYFATENATNVTVQIPALGYTASYAIPANTIYTTAALPKAGSTDARLVAEGISNKGIHVTADKPVVAYAHIYNNNVSGATLLFPTNTLGKEYYSINFAQYSNEANSNCFFYAIATDTGTTTIEVIPSANTQNMLAGQTYTYNLTQGQVFNALGTVTGNNGVDLTGSKIRSISTGPSGCKPIAVFSGSGKINIKCPIGVSNSSADNYMVQSFPQTAWGKRFLTVPTANFNNNFFRICVSDPTTVVKVNGITQTAITNNFYYQIGQTAAPNYITADKPITVAQYITTASECGNGSLGDPEVIYLSPIEQNIAKVILNSTANFAITQHFINVIIPTGGVTSFRLDGNAYTGSFVNHPQLAGYSYARLGSGQGVNAGQHTILSDSGFNAIAYGYGSAESYGYNAGTNIKDLFQHIVIKNEFAIVDFPATCVNTPFFLAITLPYQATSLKWDFHGAFPSIINNSPVADSSYIVEGKTVYLYRLPTNYVYSAVGTYPISVIATNPTPDGCSGINTIDYDLEVYDKPRANWSFLHSGCLTDSVKFIDSSNANGRMVTKWKWEFGDMTTDSVKNPSKLYLAGGSYPVKLRIITDVGCVADTTKIFNISSPPIPKFGTSIPNCPGLPVTFTDSSSVAAGSLAKWYWDYGNGQKDTLGSNANRVITYATPGTYYVKLVVETNSGCKSFAFTDTIVIHPSPVADFRVSKVCLPDSARFTDLSSIPDGSGNLFKYKWNFGDGGIDSVKNPAHLFTGTGPFNVNLVVTSKDGCTGTVTKAFDSLFAKPIANFTTPAEICLRDSSRFINSSSAANQTLTNWYWSFGNGQTMNGATTSPTILYASAGTYPVKLIVTSNQGCKSDTVTKTHVVNALPTVAFINSAPICETKQVLFTNQSTANAGNITRWYWTLGDGRVVDTANGNPFSHIYGSAGPYTVKLFVSTDKGCKADTLSKNITINAQPVAAFILPEVCLSDAFAQFTDSSYIGDGTAGSFTYAWNFGDPVNSTPGNPNTATVKNPRHKYSGTGNYSVTLTITSSNGCTHTLVKQLVVNGDIPISNFNILNSGGLCSNIKVEIQNKSTVNFGNVTKTEVFWDWANNPGIKDVDDSPIPDKIYSHVYPNFQSPITKTIQVRFLAYSGGICVDDSIRTITLNASPKTSFTTTPGICLDATPLLIAQASETGGIPGTFVFSGPGVSPAGVFDPVAAGVGTHTISYLYISNAGCRDSITQTKTVWPRPVAIFGFSSPTCEKKGVTFTDTSVANFGRLSQWKWSFGDGLIQTNTSGTPFSHIYAATGSLTASLQVVTDSGCTSVLVQKAITINPLPKPNFSVPTVCLPGGLAQFNDSTTIADGTESQFTYRWNFGDGGTSTLRNPVHSFSGGGPFIVSLAVTSNNGCTDTTTRSLTEVYPQAKATFTALPPFVCIGDIIDFSGQATGLNQSITNWYWDFADSRTGTLQSMSHLYTSAGSYNVKLYAKTDKGCFSDTAVNQVIVYPYPLVSAGPDLVVLQGGQVRINATVSAASGYRYRWTPSTWLDNDSIQTPTVIMPQNDITYKVVVTADGGCSAEDEVFVKLLLAPVIPNAFSPNRDGINDTWVIQYLESYPGATIQVFDRYGRIVFNTVGYNKPFDGKLNGTDLPVGVYYYIVDPKNGRKPMTGSITLLR